MIKAFHPRQLDRVADIWLHTNIEAHAFIPRAVWEGHLEVVRAALPASELWVWEDGEALKGFVGLTGEDYIAGLFVDRRWQGDGIGRALLAHCKERRPRLVLDVYTENARAVSFYRRNGFGVLSQGLNPGSGEAEYRMSWQREEESKASGVINP